jgi:RHS repeat-associated protein
VDPESPGQEQHESSHKANSARFSTRGRRNPQVLVRSRLHRTFTQEDPIGLAGGLNLYGFAQGDPVNFGDPFGLCPPCEEDEGGLHREFTFGVSGSVGFGVFLGAGLRFGVTDGGKAFVELQGDLTSGPLAFAGAGFTAGVNRTVEGSPDGLSSSHGGGVHANAGWGPAAGLSASANEEGFGGEGAVFYGGGLGFQLSGGAGGAVRYTVPVTDWIRAAKDLLTEKASPLVGLLRSLTR